MRPVRVRWFAGLLLITAFAVTGCSGEAPLSKEKYDKIQLGMSPEEVGKIFGFPETGVGEAGIHTPKGATTFHNDIDRLTSPGEGEGYLLDTFTTKELGGVNKKEIVVRYFEGKAEWKDQIGLD